MRLRLPQNLPIKSCSSRSFDLLKTTFRDLRSCYCLFVFLTLVFAAVSFLPPQFLLLFTETAASIDDISVSEFAPYFIFFGIGVGVALLVSTFGNGVLREWFQLRVERYLRMRILQKLHAMPLTELDKAQRGDWLTRMTGDLRNVESFLSESIPQQIRAFVMLFGSGALFIYYSKSMAIVPISASLFIAVITVLVQRLVTPLLNELRDLHGNILQTLLQSLEGIKTIRSYQAEADESRRFNLQLESVQKQGLRVARLFGAMLGSNDIVIQILTAACLTFVMFTLKEGELTLQEALIYPFYLGIFYDAAESIASSSLDWTSFFVEGGRLAELLHGHEQTLQAARPVGPALHHEGFKSLEIRNLSYGYDEYDPLLTQFSDRFHVDQIIAVTGSSGCGKSTFMEVLSGLRPGFGGTWNLYGAASKRIDGAKFCKRSLPVDLCSYVEQRPYLFEGSVRENLTLGSTNASPVEIWSALQQAHAHHFVIERGGLDAVIKDNGNDISEGQRYRLGLARSLLTDRPIILLDEPFAALDQFGAEQVCSSLNDLKSERLVILVTHYIPRSLIVDRIIDFDELTKCHGSLNANPVVGLASDRSISGNPSGNGGLSNTLIGEDHVYGASFYRDEGQ